MRRRLLAPAAALATLCALTATAVAGDGGVGIEDGDSGGTNTSGKGHVFPVPAKHTYGDGYGAGRNHEGQDIFARCGKRIRAARGGTVKYRDRHSRAGHYIVIDGKFTERDYAYMHLQRRSPFKRGEKVATGEEIGKVGDTGNASGCHLHFELWRGDWNGRPDVTRKLRKWDRWS